MERVGIIAVKFEKTMWLALPSLWSRRRRRKRRKRAIGAGAGVGWLSPHANSRHLLHWNTCSVSGFLVVFFFFHASTLYFTNFNGLAKLGKLF